MRPDDYDAVIVTPVGPVGIVCIDHSLALVEIMTASDISSDERSSLSGNSKEQASGKKAHPMKYSSHRHHRPSHSSLVKLVEAQIEAYFTNPHHIFDLPLAEPANGFHASLRHALQAIPAGATRSYGEIAAQLGTSARAVGRGCRANPLPIVVPCHRVVAVRGIGGYDGRSYGPRLEIKRNLLAHEYCTE